MGSSMYDGSISATLPPGFSAAAASSAYRSVCPYAGFASQKVPLSHPHHRVRPVERDCAAPGRTTWRGARRLRVGEESRRSGLSIPHARDGDFAKSVISCAEADAEGSAEALSVVGATTDVMEDITVRSASADAVGAVCEAIHAQLAAWVPGTLDVYVRRHPYAPETIALLLDAVEGAASCTGLPGERTLPAVNCARRPSARRPPLTSRGGMCASNSPRRWLGVAGRRSPSACSFPSGRPRS